MSSRPPGRAVRYRFLRNCGGTDHHGHRGQCGRSLQQRGWTIKSASELSLQLKPLLGDWSGAFMAIGLLAAGLSSSITAPLAAAFAVSELFAWQRDDYRFRLVWIAVLACGVLFASLDIRPTELILLAQVANALLLPVIAVFIVWVMNDRDLLRSATNNAVSNILGCVVIAVTIMLSLRGSWPGQWLAIAGLAVGGYDSAMIDLNCDMGEQPDPDGYLRDESLMPYLGSCSIACGGHAGNADSMRITANNAIKHHLKLGAHPSYPDPEHFGRRALAIESEALSCSLREQITTLKSIVEDLGSQLSYVKPHGALYNAAATDDIESLNRGNLRRDRTRSASDGARWQ